MCVNDAGAGSGTRESGSTNVQSPLSVVAVRAALQTDNAAADGLWLSFLDQLIAELGSRGVQSVIAEVNENGEELMWLKQAGFAVYTRQDIWISQQAGENDHADIFRPRQSLDDWDIQLLSYP